MITDNPIFLSQSIIDRKQIQTITVNYENPNTTIVSVGVMKFYLTQKDSVKLLKTLFPDTELPTPLQDIIDTYDESQDEELELDIDVVVLSMNTEQCPEDAEDCDHMPF